MATPNLNSDFECYDDAGDMIVLSTIQFPDEENYDLMNGDEMQDVPYIYTSVVTQGDYSISFVTQVVILPSDPATTGYQLQQPVNTVMDGDTLTVYLYYDAAEPMDFVCDDLEVIEVGEPIEKIAFSFNGPNGNSKKVVILLEGLGSGD